MDSSDAGWDSDLYIMKIFPNTTAYGVLGNHDEAILLNSVNCSLEVECRARQAKEVPRVHNLNLVKVTIGNTSFTSFNGSVKYKENGMGYSQEEALKLNIPIADILFSHETGYCYLCENKNNNTHIGYKAVSKYIKKHKPKYNVFGHHHIDAQFDKGKTRCCCVYGCSLFDCDTGNVKKIF